MKLTDRVNRWIHPWMIRYVCRSYNKKMAWCKQRHPELFKPVDPQITQEHLELWGRLGLPCSDKWLRFLTNISGIADYRYAPEDIVFTRVERILNDCERGGREAEDKNQFDLWVDLEDQPKTYLRYIRGMFYDEYHEFMSEAAAASMLKKDVGDMIGKVCVNSLGGHGISSFSYMNGGYESSKGERLTVDWIKSSSQSYILQEKIDQCDFSAQFNPSSTNSCKLVTLRCPWDGRVEVVKAGMRFGVTSDVFDNLSSGGISVAVSTKGELGRVAHNWYKADPFPEHPTTHIKFAGQVHPYFGKMKELACKYAARVQNMNMLSWDMLADKHGKIKILEVNATSQSHDWLQFDFGALFGDYTEQVVDWCAAHLDFDHFNHFRTWY
ncbi:MAG: hypothetical protein IJI54_14560 [Kiritimatiellae bacterium]|nr:hypothetical protein [Kiritimatiellia bacterium]